MKTLLELSILSLSTYRGTKLAIDDELTAELRSAVINSLSRYPTLQSKVSYLLSCPWCSSVYVAAVLLLVKKVSPQTYNILTSILIASAATGIITERV